MLSHAESEIWLEVFRRNSIESSGLPWENDYRLTSFEIKAVADSIRQFQLGEGSNGRGLIRRADQDAAERHDPCFGQAIRAFIAEEQRHSAHLGRFMSGQGIRPLESHWVDHIFRRVRNLGGLELCLSVLSTAEMIAVPYYRALREATSSPLLRAICERILREEAEHLRFQEWILTRLRAGSAVRNGLHRAFLQGTAVVVWIEHRPVFRAGGYTFRRFIRESLEAGAGILARQS